MRSLLAALLVGVALTTVIAAAAAPETPARAYADSLCAALPQVWNSQTKPGYRFVGFECKPGPRTDGVQTYLVLTTQIHRRQRTEFAVQVMPDGTPIQAAIVKRWTARFVA